MTEFADMVVQYGGLSLALSVPEEVGCEVRREMEPFFSFEPSRSESNATFAQLHIHPEALPDELLPRGEPVSVIVDTSLYKHLASNGLRWGDEHHYTIQIEVTGTWVVFDKPAGSVSLYQTDSKRCVTEAVRLIKGLFTPALELAGGTQLHASAVVAPSGCVLISGDMWHGKTTLLLEMLAQFDVAQLSCDTVVLSRDQSGRAMLSGWPSPFSVSHGTMADFPELYPFFPSARSTVSYGQLWSERKKAVLSSSDVVAQFGTTIAPRASSIDVCMFVRFAPDEPSGIERIQSSTALTDALNRVCLGSRDPIYHNWHGFIVCPSDRLALSIESWAEHLIATSEVYRMTWAPSAVSLMKRVPKIARLHKHLPAILDLSTQGSDA